MSDCKHQRMAGEIQRIGVCQICGKDEVQILQEKVQELEAIVIPIGRFFSEKLTDPMECFIAQDKATKYYEKEEQS